MEGFEDREGSSEASPPAHDSVFVRRHDVRARAREASSFLNSLLDLPRLSGADRRIAFRQVIAELARGATDEGPSPLEGIRGDALVKGVGAALEAGLADDLDWLDSGAAGCALYQLAAALPIGQEQREIGRRVLARLLAAKSDAFAAMATQMARAGGKGLLTPPVFARVAILVELPLGFEVPDSALAFAIASRRNLAREYVVAPSTRSLPERRLAARILERAARDALRRALMGDRSGIRIVGPTGALEPVWERLLADREPLVWRHVAIAKGLVAPFFQEGVSSLDNDLSPKFSPTEWRRAATALGGLAASKPEVAVKIAQRAMRDGLLARDPGAIAPFVWGLGRAFESEPEAARELFDLAEGGSPEDLADAALTLQREVGGGSLVEHVRARALATMRAAPRGERADDGATALRTELLRDLQGSSASGVNPGAGGSGTDLPLGAQLDRAIRAFHEEGAKAAHERGLALLDSARGAVDALLAIDDDQAAEGSASAMARRTSFAVVRDLDVGVLERDALVNLLRLDNREARVKGAEQTVDAMRGRIFGWLVGHEISKVGTLPDEAPHLVLHFARMKAMLHLLDSEGLGRAEEAEGASLERFRVAARAFVDCFALQPPPALRRTVMATFARCLDAVARSGACDISDVALVASACLPSSKDLVTLAEASMDPDTRGLLARLGTVQSDRTLSSFELLGEELAKVGTSRSDGLRAVLLKLQHALEAMARATSLRELVTSGSDADVAIAVENACVGLVQVHAGARSRVLDASTEEVARAAPRSLSSLVSRAIATGEPPKAEAVQEAVRATIVGVPASLAGAIDANLARLSDLPVQVSQPPAEPKEPAPAAELPAWVPARRALGAFYLERPLADGGVGSVFVVTRVEDKHDPAAERFALKVPDYNANAARHLSESEFLALFRSEASALMGLPQHPNLAHFVTFDLAARPKPILVMELVEGPNLERLIDSRSLDVARAIQTMSDVADGLAAMHDAEVGHLDLKPANVVLRGGTTAVLVDFGLAGRKIRLGCGSAPYSAPEVWGQVSQGTNATPMAVDVYAFACLAFEMFTGQILFDAETEVAMVSQHVSHDGLPPKLRAFAQDSRFLPLAELLFAGLRRDPSARIGMAEMRKEIERVTPKLRELPWPLGVRAA